MSLKTTISIALQTLRAHAVYLYSATMASLSNFLTWCSTTPLVFNLIISASLVLTGLFIWSKLHPESPKTADNNPEKEDTKTPKNIDDPLVAQKEAEIQKLRKENDLFKSERDDLLKDSEALYMNVENNQVTQSYTEFPSANRIHEFFFNTTITLHTHHREDGKPFTLQYLEKASKVQKSTVTDPQTQNIFRPNDEGFKILQTFVKHMDRYYECQFSSESKAHAFDLESFVDNSPLTRLSQLHSFAITHGLTNIDNKDDRKLFENSVSAFTQYSNTLLSSPGVHPSAIRSRLKQIMTYFKVFNEVASQYEDEKGEKIKTLFSHPDVLINDMNIKELAKEIAKYLKNSFVECMPGTPQFLSKLAMFGFGFDIERPENPNMKVPIGIYFQESAKLEPLRAQAQDPETAQHPLVFLLEHPDADYRRQDCSEESLAVDILNDSNNSSGVSDPETPEVPHSL